VPACAEAGILGALAGVIGSMAALEVIREIVGFGEGLVGRLVMFDARAMRFETLRYGWDPENPLSGEQPTIRDLAADAQIAAPVAAEAADEAEVDDLPSAKGAARAPRG
jgi:adenylyltransferase/sulfurtransferase